MIGKCRQQLDGATQTAKSCTAGKKQRKKTVKGKEGREGKGVASELGMLPTFEPDTPRIHEAAPEVDLKMPRARHGATTGTC